MTIHEFGTKNANTIVLIHPAAVMWDYFSYVWPLLENEYHVIVPALPGYDTETGEDYTSVEEIAKSLETWMIQNGCKEIACIYGCSMGGAIVTKLLANQALNIQSAIIDGGITPYQLPWILTRLIAVKDFLLVSSGKFGGMKLLQKVFATDDYSKEDLQYIVNVFQFMSYKTIWRTFDSCNNYKMPKQIYSDCRKIEYWYGASEEKERKWDLQYYRKHFPQTKFERIENVGHGGMASLHPEEFAGRMKAIIDHKK